MTLTRSRGESVERHPLLKSAYSLATNTVLTSALGFAFWVSAARLFTAGELGRDTVLVSALIELSTLGQLNLANAIVRFLPGLGDRAPRALARAYLAASAAALLIGIGFLALAPGVSSELAFLGADRPLGLAFVLGLVAWGLFALQDAALIATRSAAWIPVENGAFGALKLLGLFAAAALSISHGIFLAWVVPAALLVAPVNWLLYTRSLPRRIGEGLPSRPGVRGAGMVGFLAQDYLASIFTQATLTTLPLLVLAILGAKDSAWFAVPFTIVVAYDTLAYGTCAALVAEAAPEGTDVGGLGRIFARRVLAPLMAATLLLIVLAPLILRIFGPSYAEHGSGVLRLLLAACLLRPWLALFAALSRVRGRARRIAAVELILLAVAIGAAIPLAHAEGIEGVASAWLLANLLALACAAPTLHRELRG